ncbi:MAG: NADH/ubiquinone/plastoquinone (complex I) [Candidatus Hydrogenedentes bacterium]|nr:NADH/ubiquinone/plastoquinone (complex I) [Candidatus Hydrogenedentota bacterium]
MIADHIAPLFVAIPLAGAFLVAVAGPGSRRLPEWAAGVCTLSALLLVAPAWLQVRAGGTVVYAAGGWAPPLGISFVLDGLSVFVLLTINLVAFVVALYAPAYIARFTGRWIFQALFLLMVAGMNGVAATGDLFNLFVFLEIASVASYALVAFGTERQELEAAFKYAIMGSVASLFILLGIALIYSRAATLNMADLARTLEGRREDHTSALVAVLFLTGFGLKAALAPFHAWLPDAHPSAPAPISAMLSGVLIKALGIYANARIFFNVLGNLDATLPVLRALGAISMVAGVLLAVGQWDFKRLLAYHSISQVGYIVLGIGLGTPLGLLGGLFHLLNHALFKSLLFLDAGAVAYATGTRDLRRLGGLSQRMPFTSATTLTASLSISGIPPFNGFWSKLIIIVAAVEAGYYSYAVWAVIASILTLASFMKVMKYGFLGPLNPELAEVREVPWTMRAPMVLLAALCALGGLLLLDGPREMLLEPAVSALAQGLAYADTALMEGK